ncbi:MAG: hypothetical protein AAF745_17550, partial [Planctomycetota bacterium]
GGGLTGALGGPGGQSAFGSKAGDTFTVITVVVASIWGLICAIAMWKNNPSAGTLADMPEATLSAGPGISDEDLQDITSGLVVPNGETDPLDLDAALPDASDDSQSSDSESDVAGSAGDSDDEMELAPASSDDSVEPEMKSPADDASSEKSADTESNTSETSEPDSPTAEDTTTPEPGGDSSTAASSSNEPPSDATTPKP